MKDDGLGWLTGSLICFSMLWLTEEKLEKMVANVLDSKNVTHETWIKLHEDCFLESVLLFTLSHHSCDHSIVSASNGQILAMA